MDEGYVSKLLHVILYLNLGGTLHVLKFYITCMKQNIFVGYFVKGLSFLPIFYYYLMCTYLRQILFYFSFASNLNSLYFIHFFFLILEVVKNDEDAIEHGKII
jgi:hypothetical protein